MPVPTRRPNYTPPAETVELASLGTDAIPVPTRRPSADPASAIPQGDVAASAGNTSKGGRVKGNGDVQVASIDVRPEPRPVAKTTDKAARPSATDADPAPKPAIRPVAEKDVEVALNEPKAEILPNARKARTFAAQAIEKPTAVFMSGFSADVKAVDINRFTGKAVEFQTIAKFRKP